MTEFYRNLWKEELPKLEALRQAQLKMLREYDPQSGKLRGTVVKIAKPLAKDKTPPAAPKQDPRSSPFYWAAFVLSGDWR